MTYNKLGLKEIRFINSGHFPNENVIIDDFTLFLGSSGVGKTTVMSAVCYFYTMDKEKTRPVKKELSFYDWHLQGSYSHLIYIYENIIGKNAMIISKDKGIVKHTFINIQNYEDDISTLYFDENNRSLNLEEILANCSKKGLTYYKSETIPTFQKVMCRRSYNLLPNKDKPELDFSFYDSEESASLFGKYLFNIYSNSSVRDRGIKDMLISLISEKEHSLIISEFKNRLADALRNVSHFDIIKERRERILRLDETIITYSALIDEIDKIKFELETIAYNKEIIKTVINSKQLNFLVEQKIMQDKENTLNEEWKIKSQNYSTQIAELNNSIRNSETIYDTFIQKYKIEDLIKEQDKQNEYKSELTTLKIKINAISSSIGELETKENLDKQKAKIELNDKKDIEKQALESKKDNLSTSILQLSKDKGIEIETSISSIESELKSKTNEYTELDKKISKDETTLSLLPNQNLENSSTKKFKEEIERLSTLKKSTESQLITFNTEKLNLEKSRDDNFDELNKKIEDEVEKHTTQKEELQSMIDKVNKKLDIGKNNLFGFLNKNEVPHKRKILALASDEILFEEQHLEFKIDISNDTFYGLKVNGDVESLATKYDIETLENSKLSLQEQLNKLVARHNIKFKELEDNLKSTSNKYQKLLKEKSREIYSLSPKIKDNEIKINNENTRLKEELLRLKDERNSEIINKKEQLEKDKIQLSRLKEYLDRLEAKKSGLIFDINKKYDDKEKNLNQELTDCGKSLNNIKNKYKALIDESDKRIHETYNEIKKSKHIDTDELELLQQTRKQLDKKLELIADNRAYVTRYNDEVLPNYNKVPVLKRELDIATKQRDKDRAYFDGELKIVENKLKEIEKSINTWKNHHTFFNDFEEEISDIVLSVNKSYEPYLNNEVVLLLESKKYIDTHESYKTLMVQQSEREKTIMFETGKVIDGIPADNMMQLKTKFDINSFEENIEQYISIAKSYANFIKTKFDIEGTSLQLHRLIEAINDAVSKISHIKGTFESIVKDVNKINGTIREGIKNITIIDFIKLNFKDTGKDEIVTQIESIGDMLSANMLIGYENSERSEKVKNELVKIAQDLQTVLDKTFKKSITVADISTLTFDVSENGQVTKGIATLDSVGSTGTSIMVKAIIYITLLRMVTNKFANSERTKYHCIIDEIGQISADYFTELMKYAKQLEFVFINGTAANDDDIIEEYPRIYMGIRENQNQVELTLIDAVDAMDAW